MVSKSHRNLSTPFGLVFTTSYLDSKLPSTSAPSLLPSRVPSLPPGPPDDDDDGARRDDEPEPRRGRPGQEGQAPDAAVPGDGQRRGEGQPRRDLVAPRRRVRAGAVAEGPRPRLPRRGGRGARSCGGARPRLPVVVVVVAPEPPFQPAFALALLVEGLAQRPLPFVLPFEMREGELARLLDEAGDGQLDGDLDFRHRRLQAHAHRSPDAFPSSFDEGTHDLRSRPAVLRRPLPGQDLGSGLPAEPGVAPLGIRDAGLPPAMMMRPTSFRAAPRSREGVADEAARVLPQQGGVEVLAPRGRVHPA